MSTLTEARDTREIAAGGVHYTREFTVASGSTVYAGAITAVNSSGKAIPATSSGAITVIGRAEKYGDRRRDREDAFRYVPLQPGQQRRDQRHRREQEMLRGR